MRRLLVHRRRALRTALVVALLAVLVVALRSSVAGALLSATLQVAVVGAGAAVLWRRPAHGTLPRRGERLAPWGLMVLGAGAGVMTAAQALHAGGAALRIVVGAVVVTAVALVVPLMVRRSGVRQIAPGHAWADVAVAGLGEGVALALCVPVARAAGLGPWETSSLLATVAALGFSLWMRATRTGAERCIRWINSVVLVYGGLDVVRVLVPEPPAGVAALAAATALAATVQAVRAGAVVAAVGATSSPSHRRPGASRLLLVVPFVAAVPLATVVAVVDPDAGLSPYVLSAAATALTALALTRSYGLVSAAEASAERDGLTGLHDRRGFARALQGGDHLDRGDARLCLVDLDGFKLVNDRHGHAVGDALLVAVARRLRSDLPAGSVVGRLGGDEMIALVHAPGAGDAGSAVLALFSEPFDLGERLGNLVVGASVGVADATRDVSVEECLGRADVAMYTAKERGRDCWVAYEQGQREKVLGAATALVELRALLRGSASPDDPGRLVLHYQPVIDLVTGQPSGVEALVRWVHPLRGMVSPDDFLPLTEASGLGADLDRWVMHSALEQLAVWEAAGGLRAMHRVAVNLGVSSVRSPSLVEDVEAALGASGCAAERLLLEITEHDELPYDPLAAQRLLHLREQGISIALDDFGNGYSSVGYLRRWPVNVIKLDRSLLPAAGADGAFAAIDDPQELLDGVAALAAALGHDVVAEGVEHPDDDRAVRAVGVRFVQGWMYARPMPADELERWWRERVPPVAPQAEAAPAAAVTS